MHGLGIYMKKEYRHKTKPNQEMQIGQWQYGVPIMSFLRNERNSNKRDKNIKKQSMLKVTSDGSRLRETTRDDG